MPKKKRRKKSRRVALEPESRSDQYLEVFRAGSSPGYVSRKRLLLDLLKQWIFAPILDTAVDSAIGLTPFIMIGVISDYQDEDNQFFTQQQILAWLLFANVFAWIIETSTHHRKTHYPGHIDPLPVGQALEEQAHQQVIENHFELLGRYSVLPGVALGLTQRSLLQQYRLLADFQQKRFFTSGAFRAPHVYESLSLRDIPRDQLVQFIEDDMGQLLYFPYYYLQDALLYQRDDMAEGSGAACFNLDSHYSNLATRIGLGCIAENNIKIQQLASRMLVHKREQKKLMERYHVLRGQLQSLLSTTGTLRDLEQHATGQEKTIIMELMQLDAKIRVIEKTVYFNDHGSLVNFDGYFSAFKSVQLLFRLLGKFISLLPFVLFVSLGGNRVLQAAGLPRGHAHAFQNIFLLGGWIFRRQVSSIPAFFYRVLDRVLFSCARKKKPDLNIAGALEATELEAGEGDLLNPQQMLELLISNYLDHPNMVVRYEYRKAILRNLKIAMEDFENGLDEVERRTELLRPRSRSI